MPDQPDFDKMTPEEIAEYQRSNCIFCKIIKGEIPSRKVFEDDKVVCIMDIRPAYKGHVLMMTKEHYPFLPVIPPELSGHLFRITKGVAKALKSAMVTDKVTVFIANGGLAGQQSPHFLYHLVPRENGDGLDNFNIPSRESRPEEIEKIKPLIAQRLMAITKQVMPKGSSDSLAAGGSGGAAAASGKSAPQDAPDKKQGGGDSPGTEPAPANIQDLAKIILENPKLKELIVNSPEKFKEALGSNPDLKKIFDGVDVDKLSFALSQASKK
ncbi:HIT family protein [Candidatus Woesearchaeota archaeon]|nr:HIT family protein [Candidatus Woesearchaeota archaeon]